MQLPVITEAVEMVSGPACMHEMQNACKGAKPNRQIIKQPRVSVFIAFDFITNV
jgi:hypothetical protein